MRVVGPGGVATLPSVAGAPPSPVCDAETSHAGYCSLAHAVTTAIAAQSTEDGTTPQRMRLLSYGPQLLNTRRASRERQDGEIGSGGQKRVAERAFENRRSDCRKSNGSRVGRETRRLVGVPD